MVYVTFDAVFHFFFKNIALEFLSRVSLKYIDLRKRSIKFHECLKSLTPISIKYTQGHPLELNHFNQKFSEFLNSSRSLTASSTLNFLFFSSPIIHGKDFLNNLKNVLCNVYESLNTKCRAFWSHRDSQSVSK